MNGTTWQVVRVDSVTDGDTLRLTRTRTLDLDGRLYQLTDAEPRGAAFRLVWVDTPERGTHPGWELARDELRQWVRERLGRLSAVVYGSAGWDRLLVDLVDDEGSSASQWLMMQGNAGRGWPAYVAA